MAVAEDGVYRFPFCAGDFPGLKVTIQGGLPLTLQLLSTLDLHCHAGPRDYGLTVVPSFAVQLAANPEFTLFLGRSHDLLLSSYLRQRSDCLTMPEILRQMPATKNRLAYLLAWQTLMGVGEEELQAVSTADLKV